MKNLICSLLAIGLFGNTGCTKKNTPPPNRPAQTKTEQEKLRGTITISGAWALYPMAVRWSEEFQKIHPAVKIDLSAGGAGKGMADCLARVVDIGMISREIQPAEIQNGAWWVSVIRDAVVPTINKDNPFLKDIWAGGFKKEEFVDIWITGRITTWGQALGKDNTEPIHVYTRSDACGAAETWAKFLDKKQEDLTGTGVYGDPGLAEAVRNDPLGIGYNNVNYAYDTNTKKKLQGLEILPIDVNGNGKIDEDENFYNDRDQLLAAIAAGKYPSPPARTLHFASKGKPKNKLVIEFLRWVLTEGRQYVPQSGYINLTAEEIQKELQKLEAK